MSYRSCDKQPADTFGSHDRPRGPVDTITMSERQAVVTLYPLYSPDTFPFRSLTFGSNDDYVDIGRSSKRESKNLIPAHHNAWFDSRVMSREHARIGVNMEEKTVIIRDGGSMHGTWVNDRKIHANEDVIVNSGDVLTFGADVTRGTETFPPLRVRCGCEWFDTNDEAPKANSTTNKQSYPINTFIVPDNDDDSDVIEVDDSVPTKPMSPNESEGSDQSYDPDNCDFRENSTPITPPSNKEVSLGAEPKPTETPLKTSSEGRSDTFNGTSGSPIVLDGDDAPVTPRITPPPAPNAPDDHTTSVDVGADAMDYDSDHSSVASSPREPQSATEFNYWDEEDVISYEFGSENESGSSDDGSSDSEMDSQSDNASSHYDNMEEDKHLSQADNGSSVVNEKELGFGAAPTIQPQNTEEAQKDLNKVLRLDPLSPAPLYSPYAIPNSSLQQTDNSYAPRLPSLHALSTSGWEPQAVPASDKFSVGITPETFGHRFSARSLNRQQPPAYTSAPMMPPAPVVLSSYNGSNGVSPVKNDIYNAEGQWQVEKPGFSGQPVQRTGSVDYFQAEREPNTRVCISDIVDTRSQEARPAQEIPQKRKANEMESATMPARAPAYPDTLARRSSVHPYASGANTVPLGASQRVDDTDMDVFSQDAQPRPSMPDLDDSTQNTGIYSIDESKPVPVPEEERHSKRVKTSDGRRARGFVTHAATALAGAVVGGLGTIALLASLPPEYFA